MFSSFFGHHLVVSEWDKGNLLNIFSPGSASLFFMISVHFIASFHSLVSLLPVVVDLVHDRVHESAERLALADAVVAHHRLQEKQRQAVLCYLTNFLGGYAIIENCSTKSGLYAGFMPKAYLYLACLIFIKTH